MLTLNIVLQGSLVMMFISSQYLLKKLVNF